jgi:hypothetical protein
MPKFKDEDMKNHSLIKSEELQGCMICGEPTPYIEYICEGRLCSEECQDAFYKMMDDSIPNE